MRISFVLNRCNHNAPTKELARCWLARVNYSLAIVQLLQVFRSLMSIPACAFLHLRDRKSYGPFRVYQTPKSVQPHFGQVRPGLSLVRLPPVAAAPPPQARLRCNPRRAGTWVKLTQKLASPHLRHSRMVLRSFLGVLPNSTPKVSQSVRDLLSHLPARFACSISTPDVHAAGLVTFFTCRVTPDPTP